MAKTPPHDPNAQPAADVALERSADALEDLCRRLVREHGALLGVMRQKRDALRHADAQAMSRVCQLENEAVQRVSEMEKRRLELVGQMTLLVDPDAQGPIKLGDLADRVDEPIAGRLRAMREQLLKAMGEVRVESTIARRATASLMNHLTGLLRGVSAASTGVSTYSRRGHHPGPTTGLSTISVSA